MSPPHAVQRSPQWWSEVQSEHSPWMQKLPSGHCMSSRHAAHAVPKGPGRQSGRSVGHCRQSGPQHEGDSLVMVPVTHCPMVRSQEPPSLQSALVRHSTHSGAEAAPASGPGSPGRLVQSICSPLAPMGQQLHEFPAHLLVSAHHWHTCATHSLPRGQSESVLHWLQTCSVGSQEKPVLQSTSVRHSAQVSVAFSFTQNGVIPPHGEHDGPQSVAVSQGAQSAASLQ